MVATRRFGLALAALTALAIVLPGIVAAATSEQLVTRAESYGMTCTPSATDVQCNLTGTQVFGIHAVIKPPAGQATSLLTRASRNGRGRCDRAR